MRLSQLYALISFLHVVRKVGPYRRERPLSGVKCALAVQKLYHHDPLHCTGKLRKLPRTAVNLYGQLIDRFIENSLIKARVFVLL